MHPNRALQAAASLQVDYAWLATQRQDTSSELGKSVMKGNRGLAVLCISKHRALGRGRGTSKIDGGCGGAARLRPARGASCLRLTAASVARRPRPVARPRDLLQGPPVNPWKCREPQVSLPHLPGAADATFTTLHCHKKVYNSFKPRGL